MHSLVRRHGRFFLHAPTYATPRVSPRSLFDEVSETLAVVRNVALSRVGSVASVGATTSSIAIQNVLIQRLHPSSQEIVKIFFHAMPGEMLRVRNFHDVSRPLEGPLPPATSSRGPQWKNAAIVAMLLIVEIKISREWLEQRRVAELN